MAVVTTITPVVSNCQFAQNSPFYTRFTILFCISLCPSRRAILSRRTQCPKMDVSHNTFAKSLKQGAPVFLRNHNSDHAGSAQNLTILSPAVLPLNPFQSFVLYGNVGGGTTRSDNSDVYPCRSTFGVLKPTINARSATFVV